MDKKQVFVPLLVGVAILSIYLAFIMSPSSTEERIEMAGKALCKAKNMPLDKVVVLNNSHWGPASRPDQAGGRIYCGFEDSHIQIYEIKMLGEIWTHDWDDDGEADSMSIVGGR